MATPVGHALIGMTLARRMGMTSNVGMAGGIVAAGLPDFDVVAGALLHRDPWRLHKHGQGTHTMGFALTTGMLAGLGGWVSAGSAEGERDLIADALAGAALVGSHIVLDALPMPYVKMHKNAPVREALCKNVVNWTLDAAVYGLIARLMWRRGEERHA